MPVREGNQVDTRSRAGCALLALALLVSGSGATGQTAAGPDIVADVRTAMAVGGLTQGEQVLAEYRSSHSTNSEALEALSWLARGALAAGQFDKATSYAAEARGKASAAVRSSGADDSHLWAALGAAIEVTAYTLAEQGARSDAVYLLRNEWDTYRGTPVSEGIKANIDLVSLEGQPAPPLEPGMTLGRRLPGATKTTRQPTLLFFWAHWCQDCKAESPIIAKLAEKYRGKGLGIVAPTRRYGYVEAGRPAAPDKELLHILKVRDSYYQFLKSESVPISDANHKAYGVASIPMHVLIDREGVVRLYRPGRMTEAELEASILDVLAR